MAAEEVNQQAFGDRFLNEITTRMRDLEEKQRLLKDRMLLVGETFIHNREKGHQEIQHMKKRVILLEEEYILMKDLIKRIAERVNKLARKEDLAILQRQIDLLRKK